MKNGPVTGWLNKIGEFVDAPSKFHDNKAERVVKRCMKKFLNSGFILQIADFHVSERSVRLTLTGWRGDFWINGDFWITWYDDKNMYGCGCTVECDQCYLYWKDGEPMKSVKERISKVYDLFVMYLNTKVIQRELKDKYDATFNDVIR